MVLEGDAWILYDLILVHKLLHRSIDCLQLLSLNVNNATRNYTLFTVNFHATDYGM